MLPSTSQNRSSVVWAFPEHAHDSLKHVYAQEARLSDPHYVGADSSDSLRHSNQHYVTEDSENPARHSNLCYVQREGRSSDYSRVYVKDAESEADRDLVSTVDDSEFEHNTSSDKSPTLHEQDMNKLVDSPAQSGFMQVGAPSCELCQNIIVCLNMSQPLFKALDDLETSTAWSGRTFSCGHCVHRTCYEELGKEWDAATAQCPTCSQPFLAAGETGLLADIWLRRYHSIVATTTQITPAEQSLTGASGDVPDGPGPSIRAVDESLNDLTLPSDTTQWDFSVEKNSHVGENNIHARSKDFQTSLVTPASSTGFSMLREEVEALLLNGSKPESRGHLTSSGNIKMDTSVVNVDTIEDNQQANHEGSAGSKKPVPDGRPPVPSFQSLFKEGYPTSNKAKRADDIAASSELNGGDGAVAQQWDRENFGEIHQALTEACRVTCDTCDLLLAPIYASGKASDFTTLYLALLIRDLAGVTTTLQDMLGAPFGEQIRGENEGIFFTVCRKYLKAFLTLVSALKDRGRLRAKYIIILRPVQRATKRAAALIAGSRWSTAGDPVLSTSDLLSRLQKGATQQGDRRARREQSNGSERAAG